MSNSENKEYLHLFNVPIQVSELELDIDFLIDFCYEMKRENKTGIEKTNVGGWHSDDIINDTHTEFVNLKNKIEDAANIYHHDLQFKKVYEQKIGNIWININQKGHSNENHNHPSSIFSGVFYLTRGESSPIVFEHPFRDITQYYWNQSLLEELNTTNSSHFSILPNPNTLLMFPAWLQHKVLMNKEDTDRITFSFNTIVEETTQ